MVRAFRRRGFVLIARDDRALVVGLLGAEGPRGRGMDDPPTGWTDGGSTSYKGVQKICMT